MDNFHAPLIIAHRGSSAHAPENTFAAFKRAIDEGADGIEFDVRLSKNGEPVVFHDRTLARTAMRNGDVINFTTAELAKIDNGSWFNTAYPKRASEQFTKETVRTLEETLDFINDFKGRIFIELKCAEADVEKLSTSVCEVIKSSSLKRQIVVKSFRLAVIPLIKEHCPDIRTAALFAPKIMTILRKEKHLVKIAAEFGADELSVHYSLATKKLMKKAERFGLPVAIWTADSPRWVKRAAKLGIQSIITNDPARLLEKKSELIGS
ncbi:MAG TPA: glycerophosphodiester phosphodiesterase family protein [Pyrinomonadaceae bacterium]|nr:glycerophosphodiester phosphodiesterase family protein [Pyrinomonadaceae bacterium]